MKSIIRLLPVLFIKNGLIVRSEKFLKHQVIGNVLNQAKRLNDYEADELIYIDISRDEKYDLGRDDLSVKSQGDIIKIINDISEVCFMPLTFGGKIRSHNKAVEMIRAGADKIIINSILFDNENEVKNIIKELGSQAVVASVDYKVINKKAMCFKKFGAVNTNILLADFIKKIENLGVGEIFLQNIERDGTKEGFDIETIEIINKITSLPVIACSGAGDDEDFIEASKVQNLSAIAAGNYFNFKERSYPHVKKILKEKKINVR
jgi:imidazole glycerol-phosphate synthase subunit HisF